MRPHTARWLVLALAMASCSEDPGSAPEDEADFRSARDATGSDLGGRGDAAAGDGGGLDGAGDVTAGDVDSDAVASDADPGDDSGSAGDAGADSAADLPTTADVGTSCLSEAGAWTGTHLADIDGDPLLVDDRVRITIELALDGAMPPGAGVLRIETQNLSYVEDSLRLDGGAVPGATIEGWHIDVPLTSFAPATVELEMVAVSDIELILVRADLFSEADGCVVNRSASGAMLQVLGGEYKISTCFDMRQTRSLQVAPMVRQRSTNDYLVANGARTDLVADEFIFCPQSPTIVHATEFCLRSESGQTLSLSGSYARDGDWEVDDFLLVEVFQSSGAREADAITAQTHGGGDTFWCGETATLMCTEGCQSEVREVEGDRVLPALAVVSSQGERPRRFDDGAVELDSVLPADGTDRFVRFTALDVGEVGTLQPDLYVVSDPP